GGLVTVSRYNARYLRDITGNHVPVHFVPNGVELAPPAADHPEGPVLCVARLVPKKGVDVLVEAAARLRPAVQGLGVEIIGGGPLQQELEERARRLGLEDAVRFLGPQPWDQVEAAFG